MGLKNPNGGKKLRINHIILSIKAIYLFRAKGKSTVRTMILEVQLSKEL